MLLISAAQIRAARALLNINRDTLADRTELSKGTVSGLEAGNISPRCLERVRTTLESMGVIFTENDGVKRRIDETIHINGADSADVIFEDMLQTVKTRGGDIAVTANSQETLALSCGQPLNGRFDRLYKLMDYANIKCILSDSHDISFSSPKIQFKSLPRLNIGNHNYYIYGDKYVLVMNEGNETFKFVMFNSLSIAASHRGHFEAIWEIAAPLFEQKNRQACTSRV